MQTRNIMMRGLLWVLLAGCLMVLSKYILFKQSPQFYRNYFKNQYNTSVIRAGAKNANLRPFSTIRLFYRARSLRAEYKYKNIGGNIVGFVPLGILLPMLFARLGKFWKTALAVFSISLLFETVQLLTGTGVFDVDDLILNTAGGLIGYGMLYFSWRILQSWQAEPSALNNGGSK